MENPEYKSPFLLKLQECLAAKGRVSTLVDNILEFKVNTRPRKSCTIYVIEDLPNQGIIFTDYMPSYWSKIDDAKKDRIFCLLEELLKRNGNGVFYKMDRDTGQIRIEGLIFDSDKNLCKVFRHYYVEIPKRRQWLETDLQSII